MGLIRKQAQQLIHGKPRVENATAVPLPMHQMQSTPLGFSLEATKGHAAFPESVGIGIRIPFRKQAKLHALAVHLFVLRGESIDFTLLRLDLLLEREVVGCTSVYGVEKQHSNHNAHVYWNKNHGQQ